MSVFDSLPFSTTTATVISATASTYDDFADPVYTEATGTGTVGFFQIFSSRAGGGRSGGNLSPIDAGFLKEYDAAWYSGPSYHQPSTEDYVLLHSGTRYRVRKINPVYYSGTAIDHYEYGLAREEATK